EAGRAVVGQHHDLAIDPGRRHIQLANGPGQVRQARGPVVAIAGIQPRLAIFQAGQDAIAVVLDLVQPVAAARRTVDQGGELRLEFLGQVGGLAGYAVPRVVGRFFLRVVAGRRCLCPALAQRHDAVGHFVHHRELAFAARLAIAVLDQQPGGLFLGFAALHAYQGPAPAQLGAVQVELQVPVAVTLAGVAYRHPDALVPYDDLARAILALGDFPLELVVGNGVVFYLDGHALDRWIETGALGHRPAFHRAIEFQPE